MPVRLAAWDFSGVFTEEAPHTIADFARFCALSTEDWLQLFQKYCDVERAWDKVERGQLSLRSFADELVGRIREAGGHCQLEDAIGLWGVPDPFTNCVRVRSELFDLATKLRARGIKNCICTNNIREWRPIWRGIIPAPDLFEFIFDSSELGVRKPELAFFRHVEAVSGCSGHKVLFIDDRRENVRAAACLGWGAFLFSGDVTSLAHRLDDWLGAPPEAAFGVGK